MRDCIKLEVAMHLLLGEVGLSYMDHYFTMGFHKVFGRLALCRSSNDFQVVVNKVF